MPEQCNTKPLEFEGCSRRGFPRYSPEHLKDSRMPGLPDAPGQAQRPKRQISWFLPPVSDSFRIPMIFYSLNHFRFMVRTPGSFY